jgi:thymidylate synthase (FAD)
MSEEEQIPTITCLDHGFVRLVDYMGSDSRVVDAARVSYQQGTTAVQDDRNLIRYLIRNKHTTPLEKVVFEFHVKLPIFAARQWMRHRTGSFNEVSARYSVMKDEFYVPEEGKVRAQSKSNRQGSSDEAVTELPFEYTPTELMTEQVNDAYSAYETLHKAGVARELARNVLPVSLYTEFYWTVNLWNLMHFLALRLDGHAQYEIRVYGEAIHSLLKQIPELAYCMEAFQDYVLDAPNISKYEMEAIQEILRQLGPQGGLPSQHQERLKHMIALVIDEHPDMSKREKKESRLPKLLLDI